MLSQPVPSDFICPLTKKTMSDPVKSAAGVNFERDAIYKWLSFRSTCPVTGAPLRQASLRSNPKLQWMIRYWQSKMEAPAEQEEQSAACSASRQKRFICPLTQEIMLEPVTTRGGANFEKSALVKFIEKYGEISPMSGKPLGQPNFYPNKKLEWDIQKCQTSLDPTISSWQVGTSETKEEATVSHQQQPHSEIHTILLPEKNFKLSEGRRSVLPSETFMNDFGIFKSDSTDVLSILNEVCDLQI